MRISLIATFSAFINVSPNNWVLQLHFKRSPFGNVLYPFSGVSQRVYRSMTAPSAEHRLIVVDRNGSGRVLHYLINSKTHKINSKCHSEEWASLKNLVDFTCVTHGNKLYVIGGVDMKSQEMVADCFCYSPESNHWSVLSPLNNPRSLCSAVSIKEGILVTGGYKASGKLTNTSELFLLSSNSWRLVGSLPQSRADLAISNSNGIPVCSGGTRQSSTSEFSNLNPKVLVGSASIWQFQTEKMIWEELDIDCPQNLSKPVTKHVSISVNNKIYFIGGLKSVIHEGKLKQMTIPLMESFQIGPNIHPHAKKSNKEMNRDKSSIPSMTPWRRSLTAPKINRYDSAVINTGDYVYLIGGSTTDVLPDHNFSKGVKEIEVFDTVSETWDSGHRLPQNFDARKVSAFILKYPVYKKKTGQDRSDRHQDENESRRNSILKNADTTTSSIYYRMNFIPP